MTVRQLWTQGTEYNAVDDRLALAALLPSGSKGEYGSTVGVHAAAHLVPVLATATSVTVSRGIAFVELGGSIYLVGSDSEETVPLAPSDPTNARIDRIVLQAFDAEAGGADAPPAISALQGDAAASPVTPALTDGMLLLADVNVPAGTGVPVLTDRRVFSSTEAVQESYGLPLKANWTLSAVNARADLIVPFTLPARPYATLVEVYSGDYAGVNNPSASNYVHLNIYIGASYRIIRFAQATGAMVGMFHGRVGANTSVSVRTEVVKVNGAGQVAGGTASSSYHWCHVRVTPLLDLLPQGRDASGMGELLSGDAAFSIRRDSETEVLPGEIGYMNDDGEMNEEEAEA